MPKRKDSFSRALADATKRLEQAERQRQSTREILARLELEIPALQRTIMALDRQLNPTGTTQGQVFTHVPIPGVVNEAMASLPDGTNLTEEDTLPEPEGTPVVPEE
jgi:hypothetical protein